MADHVISLSEEINMFGLAPSTKWNAFAWGSGKWGEGTEGLVKEVEKVLDAETLPSSDTHSNEIGSYFSESQTVANAMTDTKLTDSNGYSYVFPGGTTDAEDRVNTSWSAGTRQSTTWTSGVTRGTVWT